VRNKDVFQHKDEVILIHPRGNRRIKGPGGVAGIQLVRPAADRPDAGEISLFAALTYLDFRFPQLLWREPVPQLSQWFAAFEKCGSAQSTGYEKR
jgi:hypothetical protein